MAIMIGSEVAEGIVCNIQERDNKVEITVCLTQGKMTTMIVTKRAACRICPVVGKPLLNVVESF